MEVAFTISILCCQDQLFLPIEPCEWKRSWSAGDCCWRQPGGGGGGGGEGGGGGGQVCQGTASTCNLATGNACQTWVAQPALSRFLVAVCVDQPRSEQPEYWYYIKSSRAHIYNVLDSNTYFFQDVRYVLYILQYIVILGTICKIRVKSVSLKTLLYNIIDIEYEK